MYTLRAHIHNFRMICCRNSNKNLSKQNVAFETRENCKSSILSRIIHQIKVLIWHSQRVKNVGNKKEIHQLYFNHRIKRLCHVSLSFIRFFYPFGNAIIEKNTKKSSVYGLSAVSRASSIFILFPLLFRCIK